MNILLLAPQPFFQNRGTPIAVKILAEVLGKNGHRVHLLTYHEGENIHLENVFIHRIPNIPFIKNIPPGFSVKKIICDVILFLKCFGIINKYRIDIIHAVEESVFLAMFFKSLYGLPYVYDMDSSLSNQLIEKYPGLQRAKRFFEFFEKNAVQQSNGVIAVCKALENKARKYSPMKNVLRLEDISMLNKIESEEQSLKASLNIHGQVIMYVGNLEQYQGIDLLLKSFEIALEKNPNINLVIVGGNIQDITRYRIKAKSLKTHNKIFFTGEKPIEKLGYYLHNADILVSPRLTGENTPMKIYSYLDSGKPLVATKLKTHTQVMDDEIALLTAPEPHAMADCFLKLIKNSKLSQQLASKARERVKNEFSKDIFCKKLISFYLLLEI